MTGNTLDRFKMNTIEAKAMRFRQGGRGRREKKEAERSGETIHREGKPKRNGWGGKE